MANVYVTSIINAPAEKVWEVIRDFNALPSWHPFVESSHIEGDLASDAVGCVRNFQLKDSGGTIRERLLALSDLEQSCSYNILEAPMPVSNYVATFRLISITTTGQTLGEWRASFDVPAAEEEATVALVTSVFEEGFKSASQMLSS
jgi:hypothetical protein